MGLSSAMVAPLSWQYFRTEIFLLAVTQKPAWYLLSLAVPTVP